ncbi:MAG: N-acetylmuramoyl-L-alanine amidase [Clostridia bacterium]|nr:N-acetylmuramoyl-L-alanine amidase [Clostridia bacterium]
MFIKIKPVIIISLIIALLFSGSVFAEEYFYNNTWNTHNEKINLYINNIPFSSDIPPIITNGRTLVPARTFFEALGAKVDWDGEQRVVTIEKEDLRIKLTIDNTVAYVNGKTAILDVPPMIVTDRNNIARTLIPVRFVSSWLGYAVTWDGENKKVGINTLKPDKSSDDTSVSSVSSQTQKNPAITKIETKCTDTKDIISIYYTQKTEPKTMILYNPERFVVDFNGAKLNISGTQLGYGGACYTNIRYAEHEESARVVFDMAYEYYYSVSYDNEKCSVTFTKDGNESLTESTQNTSKPQEPAKSDEKNNTQKPDSTNEASTSTPTTNVNNSNINNVVVIDPGHGGSDPGAIGRFHGEELWESECTLDISLRLQKKLEDNGIKTYMTRTEDEFVGLVERANYANEINSALFTCVHINAAAIEGAHGSEVYYYTGPTDEETKEKYGVTSKEYAKYVQDAILKHAGRYDRGTSDGSRFVVMHRTIMPAVLVECAFITNEEEYNLLKTDDFRQKLAEGIAEGVMETLKKMGRLP